MRVYTFNLFHLSSIQQGIQAGHAADELTVKYVLKNTKHKKAVSNWLKNHKTIILLNGGTSQKMESILELLNRKDNPFPFAEFKEPDMYNCMTSIAVLLPEKLYSGEIVGYSDWEAEFLKVKNSCPLAK